MWCWMSLLVPTHGGCVGAATSAHSAGSVREGVMRQCEAGGRLGIGIDGERVHASKLKVGYTGCGGMQLSGGETMCMVCSVALLACPHPDACVARPPCR